VTKAIAIETSGRAGQIAVCENGKELREEEFAHGLAHAAEIVAIIDRLTRDVQWRPTDIQQIYVSAGPGSFTGLRIAITLAKTMAFATGAKVVAVPTVRVLVENAPAEAMEVVVVLDAKRDQIFTARFVRDGADWKEVEGAHLDSIGAMLERAGRPVYLIGEGQPYHEKFLDRGDAGVIVTEEKLWRARAAVVGRIGWEMAQRGEFADVDRLTPIYIRRPEAEEKWEGKSVGKS